MLSILKRPQKHPSEAIVLAVAALSQTPTQENRRLLYRELKTGQLRVAARNVPIEWGSASVVVKEASSVPLLTSEAPDGTTALLAFTSIDAVAARDPSAGSFAMQSKAVLELVHQEDLGALVIDPQGPWAAVSIEDIRAILGDAP